MLNENKEYVIGIDGGGTKTIVALADLKGKIFKIIKVGPSNPHNVGVKNAVFNIFDAICDWIKAKKISAIFIGLAGAEEDKKISQTIKKEILDKIKNFRGKLKIGSDQIIAFRSGTNEKDGIVLIAGTGCVAHGWHGGKDIRASGWGWLDDEGSAFWVGQKVFQLIVKDLDGRGPKTFLTKKVIQKFKIKKIEDLIKLVYLKNPIEIISQFSIICDEESKRGDRIAKDIMAEAGKELALSVNTVIKKLNFQKEKFPLVLSGGMFKSKFILDITKKEIRKVAPKAKFIQPKKAPVMGAIKLALEEIGK